MVWSTGRQQGAVPATMPGAVRVRRARLGDGAVAIRTEALGIERVTVSDAIPDGEVAAVVAHVRSHHGRECYGHHCQDGRAWIEGVAPTGPVPTPLRRVVEPAAVVVVG